MATPSYDYLTKQQISTISTLAKNQGGSISSADFRRISSSAPTVKQKNKYPEKFYFSCNITAPFTGQVRVDFIGRHYSKNDISSWPLRKKLAYKTSIKEAFALAALLSRPSLPPHPFKMAKINIVVCNPRSRDDDNNQESLKIMRDCCTIHKIIKDDNRQVIIESIVEERIEKEYRVEILITKVEQ